MKYLKASLLIGSIFLSACGSDSDNSSMTTPSETTPSETTPLETTPSETTPLETTPLETTPSETTPSETQFDSILAIFAHPDDEITVAPLLAKFAREGKTVTLAIVTDGRWGGAISEIESIELAKVRAEEALCSANALGLEEPIFLAFEDGKTSQEVYKIKNKITKLLQDEQPDLILTWGPEGGYGHSDHRVVSAVVTDIYQDGKNNTRAHKLFYPAMPEKQFLTFSPTSPFGQLLKSIWGRTQEKFIGYRIKVTEHDIEASKSAAECHTSQFDEATLSDIAGLLDASKNTIYLRKAVPETTQKNHL
jgi:LmbE family N-acetylglucosaminyl deacetylase